MSHKILLLGELGRASVLNRIRALGGLTFYKNFQGATTLNADYSVGSPTATFTANRSASNPATYVDENGLVQVVTTSNIGRINSTLYNSTGLLTNKRGVVIEAAGTNLLTRTDGTAASGGNWANWGLYNPTGGTPVLSNPSAFDLTNISGATYQRITYTGVSGDVNQALQLYSDLTAVGSVVQGDVITLSGFLKSQTGNGNISVKIQVTENTAAGGNAGASGFSSDIKSVLTQNAGRFSFTYTATVATCSRVKFLMYIYNIDNGDVVDVSLALPQIEKNPYATSYIPTTTAALTRNAEVLKYETAGNRTAATETVFIKYVIIPSSSEIVAASRYIASTETKNRNILIYSGVRIRTRANENDNVDVLASDTSTWLANSSSIFTGVYKHSSPYVEIYRDGTSKGTYTAGDFTNPAWGTYWFLGSQNDTGNQSALIFQSVTIFNRALTAAEVAAVSTLLANSN